MQALQLGKVCAEAARLFVLLEKWDVFLIV
jgi:hypothetical protein